MGNTTTKEARELANCGSGRKGATGVVGQSVAVEEVAVNAETVSDLREDAVVAALKTLQANLPQLTPAEQSSVKKALPFASAEWLDGLAIATRIRDDGSGKTTSSYGSSHGLNNFGSGGSTHGGSLHGGAMRVPQRRAKDGPGMPRAESIDEMSERMIETANDARIRLTPDSGRLILVLVGLPARGKSMLGYKLERFLSWRGYKTKAFQVGAKRRHVWAGSASERVSASFFDSSKAYAAMMREQVSMDSFDELLAWMENDDGQVAVSKRARKRNPCQPPAHDSPLMMCTAWSRVFALTPHQR